MKKRRKVTGSCGREQLHGRASDRETEIDGEVAETSGRYGRVNHLTAIIASGNATTARKIRRLEKKLLSQCYYRKKTPWLKTLEIRV